MSLRRDQRNVYKTDVPVSAMHLRGDQRNVYKTDVPVSAMHLRGDQRIAYEKAHVGAPGPSGEKSRYTQGKVASW